MIRNTQELLQASQAWLAQARTDLQNRINEFMNAQGVSVDELSEVLQISIDELNGILAGNIDISLDTFAKLLIANGLAIEIKPVFGTPIGSYRGNQHGTNRRGQMPRMMPPSPYGGMPPYGMPFPPMGGFPKDFEPHAVVAPEEQKAPEAPKPNGPVRDNRGRFARRNASDVQNDPYQRLSHDALKDIIVRNNWHYEIDINTATRDELIGLLKSKEQGAVNGGTNGPVNKAEDKNDAIISALTQFFKEAPDAAEKLAKALSK